MTDEPRPTRREVMTFMASQNPVYHHMGMEVLEAVPGRSRFAMVVKPEMANTFGTCHGGVIFTLADMSFGWTCNAANEKSVTAGASIEMVGPAQVGDRMIADVTEVFRQGRNGLYDVRITIEATGAVVALVRGRMRIVGGPVMPTA
jgi:acyl-CoA thioesterase